MFEGKRRVTSSALGLMIAFAAGCGGTASSDGAESGTGANAGDTGESGGGPGVGGGAGTGGTAGAAESTGGATGTTGGTGNGGTTGGVSPTGGATGDGGAALSGGATGDGGAAPSGGATGDGGTAGGALPGGGATGDGGAATTGGAAGDGGTAGGAPSSGGAGGAGGSDAECAALSTAIAEEIAGAETCTTVVRLDYATLQPLGFQIVCGPVDPPDEATARQVAQDATQYGLNGALYTGPEPNDEYVLYESPGDFGGVGVVSARSGLAVFGGSIVWSGTGEITYPDIWRDAAALGPDCEPTSSDFWSASARAIDLSEGQSGSPMALVDALMRVAETALPDGLLGEHRSVDSLVLLYPRTVGMFNPDNAEWIVLLNTVTR